MPEWRCDSRPRKVEDIIVDINDRIRSAKDEQDKHGTGSFAGFAAMMIIEELADLKDWILGT